ncbi:MAG TPA: DUF6431 domain-containing protein [Edaphobacter sp.]|nr:DUF6431 domain-containing protein [Edaphobacter sp.]
MAGIGRRRAFTPALILFIALPKGNDNLDPEVIPLHLLPRLCPVCYGDTIIGHGQRLRQCHDDNCAHIWVRRGICKPCKKTYTILPNWLAPSGRYSLYCRQQFCEGIAAGHTADEAAPDCKDPTLQPDPSTVRRWAQRRLLSVWCWAKGER